MKKAESESEHLQVIGSGKEKRDLSYINDTVNAITALSKKGPFNGHIINICSGKTVSTAAIAKEILKVSKIRKKIIYTNKLRKGDVKIMAGSVKTLSRYFSARKTPLHIGIKESWEWYKNEHR